MAASTKPTNESRPALTRDRVLASAVALADESGIDALTMRKLADRLGVEAMSLYYHVANKEDIFNGIIDRVVSEIDLPSATVDWKTAMRERAVSARDMFTRHPWAVGLMESHTTPGPASLRYYDAVLGCLRTQGFSMEATALAFSTLDAFVFGFGIQEISLPFDNEHDVADVAQDLLQQFPSDEYPFLYEMIVDHALAPGYNFGAEFDRGLALILDGLERLRDEA